MTEYQAGMALLLIFGFVLLAIASIDIFKMK